MISESRRDILNENERRLRGGSGRSRGREGVEVEESINRSNLRGCFPFSAILLVLSEGKKTHGAIVRSI